MEKSSVKFSELILEFSSDKSLNDKLTRSKLYEEITKNIAKYADEQIKTLDPNLSCKEMRYSVKKANVRYAADIEPNKLYDLFKNKHIKDGQYYIPVRNIDKIGQDISKVKFDFENFDYKPFNGGEELGPKKVGDLSYIEMRAGGDWEYPVTFIVYLDKNGKTLRAYVPKDGNPWNYDTKQAFGNDDVKDVKLLKKLIPSYNGCVEEVSLSEDITDKCWYDVSDAEVLVNKEKTLKEIQSRIVVKT